MIFDITNGKIVKETSAPHLEIEIISPFSQRLYYCADNYLWEIVFQQGELASWIATLERINSSELTEVFFTDNFEFRMHFKTEELLFRVGCSTMSFHLPICFLPVLIKYLLRVKPCSNPIHN